MLFSQWTNHRIPTMETHKQTSKRWCTVHRNWDVGESSRTRSWSQSNSFRCSSRWILHSFCIEEASFDESAKISRCMLKNEAKEMGFRWCSLGVRFQCFHLSWVFLPMSRAATVSSLATYRCGSVPESLNHVASRYPLAQLASPLPIHVPFGKLLHHFIMQPPSPDRVHKSLPAWAHTNHITSTSQTVEFVFF